LSKRGKRADPPTPRKAAYAPVLKQGLVTTATRVQEMHHAIADKTFDALQLVPGLALPARIVQGAHDAITHSVYAAVRHGGGALLSIAGEVERHSVNPDRSPQGAELAIRSALNAAFGDALLASGSTLAVNMGFHTESEPIALTPEALAGLGERVCVFIHGLGCDEQSWLHPGDAWKGSHWADRPSSYGALLADELGISAIYLRYNTGLAIADNAIALAAQLEQLLQAAPPHLRELVLVGHSMGGLVARSAHAVGVGQGMKWPARSSLMICLGTPHQGAPLEKIGALAEAALGVAKVTQPLGRVAKSRSRGIKDLRHGLAGRPAAAPASGLALRLVAGSLADASGQAFDALVGKLLGDGLVRAASATDDGLTGDVQRVELAGLGHMALLNHPRVYVLLRGWLGATA
jgi:pimeloyl-ACP methyl ester carboxylesterase